MLYCKVLYCIALHYQLYGNILYCIDCVAMYYSVYCFSIVLCCVELCCVVLYCKVLYCIALHYQLYGNILYCIILAVTSKSNEILLSWASSIL